MNTENQDVRDTIEWRKKNEQEATELLGRLLEEGDLRFLDWLSLGASFIHPPWRSLIFAATASPRVMGDDYKKVVREIVKYGGCGYGWDKPGIPNLYYCCNIDWYEEKATIAADILLENGSDIAVKDEKGRFIWEIFNTPVARHLAQIYANQQAAVIAEKTVEAAGEKAPTRL